MTIPLQSASLYDGQEVFVGSDSQLDLGTDFLVGTFVSGCFKVLNSTGIGCPGLASQ